MSEQPKALLLYSGGFDSTVLLHELIAKGYDVTCLFFDYGQRNRAREHEAARYFTNKLGVNLLALTLPRLNWSTSTIHNQHVTSHDSQYMESRNMIFLSYAVSLAEAYKIPEVYVGFIDGNSEGAFPDTKPSFVIGMSLVAMMSAKVDISAPFVLWDKDRVQEYARDTLGINMYTLLDNVFSCNTPIGLLPCGSCPDCAAIKQYKSEL